LGIVGCYIFDKHVFEAIAKIEPSWRNELEITDAIQYLITHDFVVKSDIVRNRWSDTGKPEDILEANRFVLENLQTEIHEAHIEDSDITGKVVIENGAKILQSRIRGPVVIGKNVIVENAFIGPFTSVGDNSKVTNAEIEHSVVMENCEISDIETRLDECLFGKNVIVNRKASRPKAFRFILADNSHVEVIA